MRLTSSIIVFVTTAGGLSLCPAALAQTKLKVVTTTSDLRSIVEAVGGDKVWRLPRGAWEQAWSQIMNHRRKGRM